ncbi:MAG TPA: hypothetical protein VN397_01515 [Candidatus Methylomirabilis sp.]|nr:hypothetical protein [Candidatus Methylomirabilis sp.]
MNQNLSETDSQPRAKMSKLWTLLPVAGLLLAPVVYTVGCDASKDANKDVPAGAPSAAQSKPTSALEECGYTDAKDCSHFNLDLTKVKGKSQAESLGEAKALDCSGAGAASRNGDGTWNVCKCACVPAATIAKK